MADAHDVGPLSSSCLPDTVLKAIPIHVFLNTRPGLIATVLLLLFSFGPVVASDKSTQQPAEELEQLRARIGELKNELVSMRGQRDELQEALEKTDKDIGVVSATMRGLDSQSVQAHKNIQRLQLELDDGQQKLDSMRLTLEKELRVAYMAGKQEQVKLLLNQEQPASLGRLMVYHEYFMRTRAQAMQSIRGVLERLADVESELLLEQQEIQVLMGQQQEKSSRLLDRQSQRREILTQLQLRLSNKTTRLVALEQDERRLQKLVQSIQQAIQEIPSLAGEYESLQSLKGKLNWPVAGRISMHYGARHSSGKLSSRGVHIISRIGADVRAIARGRVVFADWLRGFGLLMIIDHGDKYMSLYGQNQSLYKDVGEWVARDEVISSAGSSGGQVEAGLYLEMRKGGRPFNPGSWFVGKPDALQSEGRASR